MVVGRLKLVKAKKVSGSSNLPSNPPAVPIPGSSTLRTSPPSSAWTRTSLFASAR
jgi:hypothetical protein